MYRGFQSFLIITINTNGVNTLESSVMLMLWVVLNNTLMASVDLSIEAGVLGTYWWVDQAELYLVLIPRE
jgi:hypothetical protein